MCKIGHLMNGDITVLGSKKKCSGVIISTEFLS